jgi:acyl-coenzyme A synthetase/AMP-(fatty) acid ligase
VPLIQVYGSTETCPIAVYIKAADAERKAGSTGKPAAHCRMRLVDDLDRDVSAGATGEILDPGPERHERLLAQSAGQRRSAARRLVPQRRHGPPRRRGLL